MSKEDLEALQPNLKYAQYDAVEAGAEASLYTPKQLEAFAKLGNAYRVQANATDARILAFFYELGKRQQRAAAAAGEAEQAEK